jgi:hypothetical protein
LNRGRKLDQIQANLTASGWVLYLIAPAVRARTPAEYVRLRYLSTTENDTQLLNRLLANTRLNMKGKRKEAIDQAVRAKAKDVLFLLELVDQINGELIDHWEEHYLRSLLLLTEGDRLDKIATQSDSSSTAQEEFGLTAACNHLFLDLCIPAVFSPLRVAATTASTYFDERPILFLGAVDLLEEQEEILKLALESAEFAGEAAQYSSAAVEEYVGHRVQTLTAMARIRALLRMEQGDDARKLIMPRVEAYRTIFRPTETIKR